MFVVEESRNACFLTERGRGRGTGHESVETDDTLRGAGDEGMSVGCPHQNAFFDSKMVGIAGKRCCLLGEGWGFLSFRDGVGLCLDTGFVYCWREGGMGRKAKKLLPICLGVAHAWLYMFLRGSQSTFIGGGARFDEVLGAGR